MAGTAALILANRAYGDHQSPPPGAPILGSGGLVAAVGSAIAPWDGSTGTLWIGAGRGAHDTEYVDEHGREVLETGRGPLQHQRLFFDEATWTGHYEAVANGFLWPLLHHVRRSMTERAAFFPRPVLPTADEWHKYEQVNAAFARAAAAAGTATAWVHDYQLALVPRMLRDLGYEGRIGFFLHTPLGPPDVASVVLDDVGRERLRSVIAGILGADLAGFQTERDRANFENAARALCGAIVTAGGVQLEGRTTRTGSFPVGVNAEDVTNALGADLPAAAGNTRGLPLVVALERADFTKGIPERMEAVARAYADGARFAYFGAASPTREGVALYEGFAEVITAATARAAAAAREAGCPFQQVTSSLSWGEVVALLARADVVFTSSLADGMNLVPLQAVVAQAGRVRRGVAIAGRDAGVSIAYPSDGSEGLIAVDPLETWATADVLRLATGGRLPGMSDRLVVDVRTHDSARWAESFMSELEAT
ncbi:MAG: trehalose-6-phosphate synthase [Dehalococcoidia bacterium]|nr:trehalose-6-phosphate synthase [Dehalococcoidia bacterium]MCB9486255.1 trehalose-6-phosphate synthase [Thermoflexaceae bacterium]